MINLLYTGNQKIDEIDAWCCNTCREMKEQLLFVKTHHHPDLSSLDCLRGSILAESPGLQEYLRTWATTMTGLNQLTQVSANRLAQAANIFLNKYVGFGLFH